MATTQDQHYVQLYNANVQLLAMQEEARIANNVTLESQEGEYEFFNQVGAVGYTTVTDRTASTTLNAPTHYRRRVGLANFSIVPYLAKLDEVRMGWADPTSTYVRSAAATLNQIKDDVVIAAMDGTAYTDKTGGTSTAYDTGNDIAISGAMTLAAVIEAKRILDAAEVPADGRFIAMGALDLASCLNVDKFTSADYAAVKALVNGEINTFFGFTWLHSERLGLATAARKIFYWQRDGVILSTGSGPAGMFTRIDERADLNYTKQIFTWITAGATRMQETHVGRILRTV
jgi:hypothetical protein